MLLYQNVYNKNKYLFREKKIKKRRFVQRIKFLSDKNNKIN